MCVHICIKSIDTECIRNNSKPWAVCCDNYKDEASNEREEKKNIDMYSMEIKRKLYKHRGDCRSHEKIDKEIRIPCDKIIICHDKIKCTEEKVPSPFSKKVLP